MFQNKFIYLTFIISLFYGFDSTAQNNSEVAGYVYDQSNQKPVAQAQVEIQELNINTVTNAEGYFKLKYNKLQGTAFLTVNALGFKSKKISLNEITKTQPIKIFLNSQTNMLPAVEMFSVQNLQELVKKSIAAHKKFTKENTQFQTAFYRETIKKSKRPVSLAESVIRLVRPGEKSFKNDKIAIYKARKITDYDRLDTLAFKMQGGPYAALYTDIITYNDKFFDTQALELLELKFLGRTQLSSEPVLEIGFKEKIKGDVWFSGSFFIHEKEQVLVQLHYTLNVEDRKKAARYFVSKRPRKVKVYPEQINYEVHYFRDQNIWRFGYSQVMAEFTVNKKGKLFNTKYFSQSELLVTKHQQKNFNLDRKDYIREDYILIDDRSGFEDATFWGKNNIIEPDKSILNAIEKIRAQL
ncbi:carboxypeptidase-like regulatory domain-containing protein [Mesonia sp. HuA40]|uniref:carboxypeptidase-like regulatory domain-containing protein n=1 Tax=Mesonia sp. HuA40 TaxID=2602761 RepID=UPI0011C8F61F|nr:carboxypeptidase-like regulatory domain-containing protein [Mesonia sp. HuA40]TXK73244.1 carboxypeptidase-like regulatory domain-containing protein [Mesonia sp. HuA40]